MSKVILDTDVLIDVLRGRNAIRAFLLDGRPQGDP